MIDLSHPTVATRLAAVRAHAAEMVAAKAGCRVEDVAAIDVTTVTYTRVLADPTGTHRAEIVLPMGIAAVIYHGPGCGCPLHTPQAAPGVPRG